MFMILWHTADSWIRDDLRSTATFTSLRLLGGLAAPFFLLLAGVSLGMKHATEIERATPTAYAVRSNVGRGLEVWVIGYLLRLQMWTIDSGGIRHLYGLRVWPPILVALCIGIWASRKLGKEPRRAAIAFACAAPLFAFGIWQVTIVDPTRLVGLVRVDVLQAIGASLVVVSLASPLIGTRAGISLAIGIVVAFATPLAAKLVPGPLPAPIAAYLAQWPPPPGGRVVALFPLFPWLSYVFIGRSLGLWWHAGAREQRLMRLLLIQGVFGALLAIATNESIAYHLGYLNEWPWLTAPVRVASRVGAGLAASLIMFEVAKRNFTFLNPLRTLGTASLLVYFVHLEFAYGLLSLTFRKKLSLMTWGIGFISLTILMFYFVEFRRGPYARWLDRTLSKFRKSS